MAVDAAWGVAFRTNCRWLSLSPTVDVAVDGGPRDAESRAYRGDVGQPAVIARLGQREPLRVSQLFGPSPPFCRASALPLGRCGAHAVEVTLELGERAEDVEDGLASRRGRVDLLGERPEPDPEVPQVGDDLDQVLEGAPNRSSRQTTSVSPDRTQARTSLFLKRRCARPTHHRRPR